MIEITIYDNESDKYYKLVTQKDGSIGLFNQDNEGMTIKNWYLFDKLDEYFKENF